MIAKGILRLLMVYYPAALSLLAAFLSSAPGSAGAAALCKNPPKVEIVGKRGDLPDDDLVLDPINPLLRDCDKARTGDDGPPYRFLLQIDEHDSDSLSMRPEWSLTLRSGGMSGETYKLTLNQEMARGGERFLSPVLNWSNRGYCISDSSGSPPSIRIVAKILEEKESVQLSAAGAQKDPRSNFTSASALFDAPLSDRFPYWKMYPSDSTEECRYHSFWARDVEQEQLDLRSSVPDETSEKKQEREKKARARLSAAFAPIVWLGLEIYDCEHEACTNYLESENTTAGKIVFKHCSGFFIGRRVIITNAHCVQRDDIDHRYAIRGWLRPPALEKDNTERLKAPELQKLTPVIVGDNGLDFALLWVEEANFKGPMGPRLRDSLPEPLRLTVDPDWPYDPDPPANEAPEDAEGRITIVGYPTNYALQASFDNYCRIRNNPSEGDRKYPAVLAHSCDTLGGNSGSPVFDRNLRRVGALHNEGIREDLSNCLHKDWKYCRNKAVTMVAIKEALEEVLSSLESDAASPHMPLSPLPPGGRRETIDAGLRRRALEDIWCAQDEFLDSNPAFTGVCSDQAEVT